MAKRSSRDDNFEEAPPDPAATIESLRSLGYSPESAIADLIDNSIASGATAVDVKLHWAGGDDSWCAVIDDGSGMTEERLRAAMRIGSADPLADRGLGDLGRFGFGLKTASFSQCREVTVLSRTLRQARPHVRCWDLDHVREVGRWQLRRSAPPLADAILDKLAPSRSGTVVLWRRLDELVEAETSLDDSQARKRFLESTARIERHLGMTFERFLRRRPQPVRIRLNGRAVSAWDPFLTGNEATQALAAEKLSFKGHTVVVSPYVLPHVSKLSERDYEAAGGPQGWNGQQGFYVYRADRLITAGDWLGLGLTRDDNHNLARIAIDAPVELDLAWSLDVTKATVRPPNVLRDDLKRIANETRRRARRVLSHRGSPVGDRGPRAVVPIWHQRRRHGELVFVVNRQHPLIVDALADLGGHGKLLKELLHVIEDTVPVPALPTEKRPEPRMTSEGNPPPEVVTFAGQLYETFLSQGLTRAQAADRLLTCQPFNEYPDIDRMLRAR